MNCSPAIMFNEARTKEEGHFGRVPWRGRAPSKEEPQTRFIKVRWKISSSIRCTLDWEEQIGFGSG